MNQLHSSIWFAFMPNYTFFKAKVAEEVEFALVSRSLVSNKGFVSNFINTFPPPSISLPHLMMKKLIVYFLMKSFLREWNCFSFNYGKPLWVRLSCREGVNARAYVMPISLRCCLIARERGKRDTFSPGTLMPPTLLVMPRVDRHTTPKGKLQVCLAGPTSM